MNNTDPLLSRLWSSSTDLLDRFKAQPSVKQAADRMMSEVLELVVAAHDTYGTSTDEIAEEAADVMVTMINVLRSACVTPEQFERAIHRVIVKNSEKTDETHQLNVQTQGVERIGKVQTPPSKPAIIGWVSPVDGDEVYARSDFVGDQWHGYNIQYTLKKDVWVGVVDTFEDREGDIWHKLHDGHYVFGECVNFKPAEKESQS